jgi:hypothetical protein
MATFTQKNQDRRLVYYSILAPKHSMFLTHKLRNMRYTRLGCVHTIPCIRLPKTFFVNNIFHDKYIFTSIGFHIFVELKTCWKRMFETTCAKDNIFTQVTFYWMNLKYSKTLFIPYEAVCVYQLEYDMF